ncbi:MULTISPECIES: hypothetical protein [Rhodococcus]|uniref:hypothetical protein n=1 Tax=Rhodococcus TaxID=1827 RepID=UPI001ED90CD7|nr:MULTISPECIES: hypothetical protein [Rhodococcus]
MQAFIDENTVRGIMVVAAVADPSALDQARRTLTALRLKGQERIHFSPNETHAGAPSARRW